MKEKNEGKIILEGKRIRRQRLKIRENRKVDMLGRMESTPRYLPRCDAVVLVT